jgi:ATP-dependent DNA ligase
VAQERPRDARRLLLLGLFDDAGTLHHVGVTSSFTWDKRAALTEELAPLREHALDEHPWKEWAEWATAGEADASGPAPPRRDLRAGTAARISRGSPCAPSAWPRWPTTTSRAIDFRHGTTFQRWRPDKPPEACRYDQLETSTPYELEAIFG